VSPAFLRPLRFRRAAGHQVFFEIIEVGRARHLAELTLHVAHLGLAHQVVDVALELARERARLRHPLAQRAERVRQILRADNDERHHADEEKLAPAEVHEL
jgi:hypothetical protein